MNPALGDPDWSTIKVYRLKFWKLDQKMFSKRDSEEVENNI